MSAVPEGVLNEKETAALLRISTKALQGWRYKGTGPKFLKLGSCVRYRRSDLQDFVLKALRSSTSDPGPGR
jgi:predicted DNA-binding transcriptional regulator AlpA